jgi:hypothetical protein
MRLEYSRGATSALCSPVGEIHCDVSESLMEYLRLAVHSAVLAKTFVEAL